MREVTSWHGCETSVGGGTRGSATACVLTAQPPRRQQWVWHAALSQEELGHFLHNNSIQKPAITWPLSAMIILLIKARGMDR